MANNRYLNEKDIYEALPNKQEISLTQFKLISKTFFSLLMLSVIDEAKVYWLPNKLGIFGVFKTKTKEKMINWQHYKKTGEKLQIRNLHSHGLMTKLYWIHKWPKFDIGDTYVNNIFQFKGARDITRYLAAKLKTENIIFKYHDYDN